MGSTVSFIVTVNKNVLFIMCDQLRWDYLSCAGHPTLQTPNIDAIAARGVRFPNAYCQAPLCGPSRASFYSGRYMSSHGTMANEDPARLGELRLGDYLRDIGVNTVLVGKSEVHPNHKAFSRLKLQSGSDANRLYGAGGFEEYERFGGIHPDELVFAHPAYNPDKPHALGYNRFLAENGFDAPNPWNRFAAGSTDENGTFHDGWQMRNAHRPADVPEQFSETAFTTDRAIEFIEQQSGSSGWCLHLSYIKPHWPYIAPAPYHNMYSKHDVIPAIKHSSELENPHPVYSAFMQQEFSRNFARDEMRGHVIPAYMGLITQVDDHIGRVLSHLKTHDLDNQTMIVLTSDHGDYLGDHWLGEKDLFHEPSVRIPMIVYDPDPTANDTRGTVDERFVESVDLVPTLVEFMGGEICKERIEGESLLPLLRSESPETPWRDYVISEIDFSDRGPRTLLDVPPYLCRAHMLRNKRWKYILHETFRPQLFDMENDPNEFVDLGDSAQHAAIREEMHEKLFTWFRRRKIRTEMDADFLLTMGPQRDKEFGIRIGEW